MTHRWTISILASAFLFASLLAPEAALGQAPPSAGAPATGAAPAGGAPTTEQRVAALKQSLAQSAQNLRKYQWVEATTITMKGEVKSQKSETCYYGADGKLQKTPLSSSPPPKKKGGLRGKAAESKGAEIQAEMKQAVELVHTYAPPDPTLIQKCKDAGKVSMEVVQPNKVVRVVFKDYRLPGDSLAITMDMTTNSLLALDVATYLGKPDSPVTMNAKFAKLADGTVYTASTVLGLKKEELDVAIANSGYKPLN